MMKNSNVEWIGQIPDDWIIGRGKNCFRNIKRIVGMKHEETERLALTLNGVIKRSKENSNGLQPEKFDTYQYLLKNELVFKLIDLGNIATSRVGISNYDGMVSPAYIILRNNNSHNRFYYYFYLSMWHHNIFNSLGDNGVRSSLNAEDLLNVPIVIPKSDEQKKIADLLDKKCEQIDRLIEIQQQEIEKLKEYKTSVITQAVTKGLDPNVPMKDSGIEWIGQIPQDWELKKLKNISNRFYKGNGISKDDIVLDGEIGCVRYGDIYTKYNNSFYECKVRTNINKVNSPQYFEYGDILFTTTGELVEEIGKSIAYLGEEKCLAGGDVLILKHNQNPEFFGYALDSHYARIQKGYGKAKLKVVHTSQTIISNMMVVLPNIEEQKNIVFYLNKKSKEIERLLFDKQQKIEKLQEYKKSMIYEYVTGKRRVI